MKSLKSALIDNWQNLFKFASVGGSGAIVNLLSLWSLTNYYSLFYMWSALISIELSILWNFALNTKITFNYKFDDTNRLFNSLIRFHLASSIGILINLAALYGFTEFLKIHYILSEVIAISLAFGFNYILSIKYVWNKRT
ncbi:MAG: GtrA family protein [Methanothrix sp.]|nr:MAG: GtrA family protein [Methanothrix sp.]